MCSITTAALHPLLLVNLQDVCSCTLLHPVAARLCILHVCCCQALLLRHVKHYHSPLLYSVVWESFRPCVPQLLVTILHHCSYICHACKSCCNESCCSERYCNNSYNMSDSTIAALSQFFMRHMRPCSWVDSDRDESETVGKIENAFDNATDGFRNALSKG